MTFLVATTVCWSSEFCAGLDQELVDNLNVIVFLDGVLEPPLHRLKAVDSTCD